LWLQLDVPGVGVTLVNMLAARKHGKRGDAVYQLVRDKLNCYRGDNFIPVADHTADNYPLLESLPHELLVVARLNGWVQDLLKTPVEYASSLVEALKAQAKAVASAVRAMGETLPSIPARSSAAARAAHKAAASAFKTDLRALKVLQSTLADKLKALEAQFQELELAQLEEQRKAQRQERDALRKKLKELEGSGSQQAAQKAALQVELKSAEDAVHSLNRKEAEKMVELGKFEQAALDAVQELDGALMPMLHAHLERVAGKSTDAVEVAREVARKQARADLMAAQVERRALESERIALGPELVALLRACCSVEPAQRPSIYEVNDAARAMYNQLLQVQPAV
jgi:DNA repair exonuclease SbcCD ATPase subunit